MKMLHRELTVYSNQRKTAHLFEAGSGDWQLVYEPGAAVEQRLSTQFPVREQAYQSPDVRAWFRNLLPARDLCRMAAQQLGVTPSNDFALIAELCGETLGAVQIFPAGESGLSSGDLRELSNEQLRNIFAAMAIDPLLTRIEGYRFSLPGDHPKLAVRLKQEKIYLPLGSELSSHIIKPAYEDRRESLENESFCMALAGALRLPVVETALIHGASNYLLIQRFDRIQRDEQLCSIAVEDFSQLALIQPENAFQREGGLSAAECVDLLRAYSVQPAVDIKHFIHWLIFNFLIGNGHATSKQLALLYGSDGPRLAPFFGLSSTHIYPQMNHGMAMHLGGEARPDWMIPQRWREFAETAEIRPKYILTLLETLSVELMEATSKVEAQWQRTNGFAEVTATIRKLIERRARQLVVSLQAEAA